MKILLLTYYFPPDLCAGSFRAQALAEALMAEDPTLQLEVLTTAPHRYARHSPSQETVVQETVAQETVAGAYQVTRLALPRSAKGWLSQMKAFLAFALGVRRQLANREYDGVIATSSRLMTACLGGWAAARTQAPLYLDIRDIFVETLDDVFPGRWLWPVRRFFALLERWPLNQAHRVNLVSEGFLPYFKERYARSDYSLFTNGIDTLFMPPASGLPATLPCQQTGDLPHLVYAGHIGEGQGLEKIIPALALALSGQARITLVGDGGRRDQLLAACQAQAAPVTFLDPQPREALKALYDTADVLFLHLNAYPAFERVLPSKLFEYAATGKPILAGVSGYAQAFIARELPGVAVFPPGQLQAALEAFHRLEWQVTPRSAFVEHFRRDAIMAAMAKDILH